MGSGFGLIIEARTEINRGFEEYRTTSSTILVDVREANEFATVHIPGAVNAPLSTISNTTLPKEKPLFL